MKKILALVLAIACSICGTALAATQEQSSVIPVTVTVVRTSKHIDVTMPATMPVSVLDGKVLTADNVEIVNNSSSVDVEITGVRVEAGAFEIGNFNDFDGDTNNTIALKINGATTTESGELDISEANFGVLATGERMAIDYDAKVSTSDDVKGLQAASVVFVLRPLDKEEMTQK